MFTQRAIRYWQDKPVPRDLLEKVIAAAAKAPSGSNTQPWIFVVVDEDEKRQQIGQALRSIFEAAEPLQNIIAAGEASEDKTERMMLRGARAFFSQLEKAPAMVIPCLYGLSSPTADPTTLLAGSSIYMAVQNLMLAARSLGLGRMYGLATLEANHDLVVHRSPQAAGQAIGTPCCRAVSRTSWEQSSVHMPSTGQRSP